MHSRFPLRYGVLVLALYASPAPGHRVRGAGPLPEDPDALVARMAGENLPFAAQKRRIPKTPGWHAAGALIGMRDDAVPALTRGLESDDHSIRLNAVYVLGR